jgi:hypothetical protein
MLGGDRLEDGVEGS